MSTQSVARQFVDLCNQGKNFDVMRTLYSPDIVSVEGDGTETAGQQKVIKKSEDWVADKRFDFQAIRGPFTVNDSDRITREQFFFEGKR